MSPSAVLAGQNGHSMAVNDIALSKDGTNLFSASSDGTVKIWNLTRTDVVADVVLTFGQEKEKAILRLAFT